MHRLAAGLCAALGAVVVASPSSVDATVPHTNGLVTRKAEAATSEATSPELPLLGTLVQTHTDERVPLDDLSPSAERFSQLLADRVTGARTEFDPKLLELLRSLARRHPGARFELVSGFRSPKLNEMMRKKGHHVASHSQHSLGHAVDFRIVLDPDTRGIDPRDLEKEIRELGWEGGVGVYTLKADWFVHADVGKLRRWAG
jgi:uncharacterized protein YcbK (DUF882 family)